jgi:hypothetical protein
MSTTTNRTVDDGADEPTTADSTEFADVGEWFAKWYRHAMAGHFDNSQRWCAQWWQHQPVVVRLDALWRAWETARAASAEDDGAMSAWWAHHSDPHWRAITAHNGPLHQCTPDKHTATGPVQATPSPPGWFDPTP